VLLLTYGLVGGEHFFKIDLTRPPAEVTLIDAANFIEKNISKTSLVVHPPSITNFQYLSHRSSFVSFKAVPLAPNLLPEWFHRLQYLGVYSNLLDYRTLKESVTANFENYHNFSGADFVNLAAKYSDITHIVLDKRYGNWPILRTLYENANYQVCIPVEQEKRLLAETAFPISLPAIPVSCDDLLESGAARRGWVNRGSRGTIFLKRADGDITTLQLTAGTPNQKGEHILLLSPKAESKNGFPVVSGGQGVVFECDLRFAGKTKSGGDVQLRLDMFSSQDEWSYHPRKVYVTENWHHFEASASLVSNAVSVYPTLIWNPTIEGSVLEMRAPRLRWLTTENKDKN
jgi:hypothetical protein